MTTTAATDSSGGCLRWSLSWLWLKKGWEMLVVQNAEIEAIAYGFDFVMFEGWKDIALKVRIPCPLRSDRGFVM